MSLAEIALVAAGGGAGAVCRFLLDRRLAQRQWRTMQRLLLINVVGSAVLGIVVGLATQPWLLLLGTGVCGGFTTFSTVMVELAGAGGTQPRKPLLRDLGYLAAMSILALGCYWVALHITS